MTCKTFVVSFFMFLGIGGRRLWPFNAVYNSEALCLNTEITTCYCKHTAAILATEHPAAITTHEERPET